LNSARAVVTLGGIMLDAPSTAGIPPPSRRARTNQGESHSPEGRAISEPNHVRTNLAEDGLWERQVAAWKLLGPPLRPSPEDVVEYELAVANWSRQHGIPRGLILGATPELARLHWPEGARVLAVDRSQVMIEKVWPGHPKAGLGGRCGDWLDLPLARQTCDLVLGDGSFTQLDYPQDYRGVFQSIRRVLTDHGVVTIRFFVRSDEQEHPEAVLADLWRGGIGSFHVLKLRLAMALQECVERGVQLHTVWNFWANSINRDELIARLGWSPRVISTMDNYRGLTTRYTFPTLAELRQVIGPEFREVNCVVPKYAFGERCPILTLKPSPDAPCRS